MTPKTLNARLKRIEGGRGGTQPLVIFLQGYRDPDASNPPPKAIIGDAGQRWERMEGETEEELKSRASSEVRRNKWGVVILTNLP